MSGRVVRNQQIAPVPSDELTRIPQPAQIVASPKKHRCLNALRLADGPGGPPDGADAGFAAAGEALGA